MLRGVKAGIWKQNGDEYSNDQPHRGIVEAVDLLPPDAVLIQQGVSWDEYEELLEMVGEASSLRISYDDGTLQIMTVSQKHEEYSTLIERIVDLISLRLRIKILFYGSATMRKKLKQKA